jgi:cytoskeletal protein CcmA (bactofilin family)
MAVNINVPSQVRTFANLAAFPATGALKTIYIAEDTNKTYRWTGSVYVEISGADFSGYVPTSRTLTINGTTQDLSANRTFTIPTDLTIGTTPIASGTVGRVLFEGTGNVLQESANLFWDDAANRLIIGGGTASFVRSNTNEFNIQRDGLSVPTGGSQLMFNLVGNGQGMTITNQNATTYRIGQFAASNVLTLGVSGDSTLNLFTSGNVGIGTTTNAGFKLDVNGTARVQGLTTLSGTMTASGAIARNQLINGTLVAAANGDALVGLDINSTFTNGAFTGVLNHSIRTSQNTGIAIAIGDRSNQLGFANPALISLGASYGTNGLGNINNAKLLIFDGGGNGSSSAGLGYSLVGGAYQFEFFTQSNYVWSIGNGSPARTPQMRMFSTGNLLLQNGGTFTDAGFRLDVNGTARVVGQLTINDFVFNGNVNIGFFRSTNDWNFFNLSNGSVKYRITGASQGFGISDNGYDTVATSAMLQVNSTTKGFLPPRMTTTQKNAIASPATGLQIYDSTLNRPCFYDGTSWITL